MFAVIFRATLVAPDQEYLDSAQRLRELAMDRYGCLDFISLSEGEHEIAISYWESESAIAAWREDPEHRRAQQAGRERWYSDYTVEVVEVRRAYRHKRDG